MILSKSRYVAGLQCHKLLWLKVHEADAPELVPTSALTARFEGGHRVGELARAYFPGGTLIELDPRERGPGLQATAEALARGDRAIFEACFEVDGAFAAIDVLERVGAGFVVIEVKATLSAKPQHLEDLAMQVHLARRAGLRVDRVEVMHLNRKHRHPKTKPLFVRTDVTEEVNALVPSVAARIKQQRAMVAGDCPEVEVGFHCDKPYPCPFTARCWPVLPEHDVSELVGMSRQSDALRDQGYEVIADIPEDFALKPLPARQRRAVVSNTVVVEGDLAGALRNLPTPVAFLDFETIAPALPVWSGCRPYQAIPVQHSVHRLVQDGALEHDAFLAEPNTDPRETLAQHLLAATDNVATVFAWNATFERQRIQELAVALPQLRDPLLQLASRVHDLLPIVRNHVYHPDFHGSFSLKAVGPALVPELGYAGLEVADGGTASAALETYLLHPETLTDVERTTLRTSLLAYCERDTRLLVEIYARLRALA